VLAVSRDLLPGDVHVVGAHGRLVAHALSRLSACVDVAKTQLSIRCPALGFFRPLPQPFLADRILLLLDPPALKDFRV